MTTSACHSRILRVISRRFSRVGSSSPSWIVENLGLDAQNLSALLDLLGAAASENRAGQLVMADVAVGDAHELDLVAGLGPPRGRAAGLELAVVGVCAEDNDSQA